MKQFIIMLSMIALGCFIYQLIAGPDDSVYTALQGVWQEQAEAAARYV